MALIPLFVQPPNKPQAAQYVAEVDEGHTWQDAAAAADLPLDRVVSGRIFSLNGTRQWVIVLSGALPHEEGRYSREWYQGELALRRNAWRKVASNVPAPELIARTIELLADFRAALDRQKHRRLCTAGDERRYAEAGALMGELRPFTKEG